MAQFYEVRVEGHLDHTWADWLGGLAIIHEAGGTSLLAGALPDQAALHSVLSVLGNLGVQLISVNTVDDEQPSDEEKNDD